MIRNFIRCYRPALADPSALQKVMAVRERLTQIGVSTGLSRAKRNGLTAGTGAISVAEAIKVLKDTATVNSSNGRFNSLTLNIKVRLTKEQSNGVRGVLDLPRPELLAARPSILVFATGTAADSARAAGASIVGGEELLQPLLSNELTFNRCLATTSLLPTVMKAARFLGPRGQMPNVKTGTLVAVEEISGAVRRCMQSVPFRIEKRAGLLNMTVGRLDSEIESLNENVRAVIDHLIKMGPKKYVERVFLSTRGHPGIMVQLEQQ